jgi:formylglycine-generating enzyme required for sulfatase activity
MAQEQQTATVGGPEVTIKGIMMCDICCTRDLKGEAAKEGEKTMVLFAVEGTPEVAAALDAIMKEHYPGDSIDADHALKIQEEFEKRLKYYITPGDLATKNQREGRWRSPPMAVTGIVSEKDGKKWITASKIAPAKLKYPDKMLAPDKPLVMPGKEPLILKVNDTLSLKCILLPAGKFMMGNPFYSDPRWQDEYPHLVTLTKPFYLAEIPVTQEMYEAVMGANPSTVKDPKRPVRNVLCTDINKFCQILSEKNGRKVRLPTEAEWEYAARVGTSNPPFAEKYKDQNSGGPKKTLLPVKSKQPNAWGLYDMISEVWEMTSDKGGIFHRKDEVDPYYSCEADEKAGRKHGHLGKGCSGFLVSNHEGVQGGAKDEAYGTTKFRVAVEATPEEIADMEKAAKK